MTMHISRNKNVLFFMIIISFMLSLKTYADTITSTSRRMIELKGKVFDRLTTKEIPEVDIAVLNQDSTLAAKAIGLKKELILNRKTGQYKNFSYAVNAQGRTETIFNSLRRYLLFSIQFRLDAKPRHR